MTLTERIVTLHQHLTAAGLAHAFGGALALAFCTREPRGTKDIDVNVFIEVDRLGELLLALPAGVEVTDAKRSDLRRDGQCRLWWDGTPVDIFLSNHPYHDHAEANRRHVPFAGVDDLPVLACSDLAVFKAFFARPKDRVDLATMALANSIDLDRLEASVVGLMDDAEARRAFFDGVRADLAQMR